MEQRGRKMVMAVGLLAVASACASGDGVPTATIENGLDTCIVEASFLNYGFVDPIGPDGRMSSREVIVDTGLAYAVAMSGDSCVSLARQRGGTLWVTNVEYSAEAGQMTTIRFSPDTAREIETACTPEYVEGLKRFSRLYNACDPDAETDAGAPD